MNNYIYNYNYEYWINKYPIYMFFKKIINFFKKIFMLLRRRLLWGSVTSTPDPGGPNPPNPDCVSMVVSICEGDEYGALTITPSNDSWWDTKDDDFWEGCVPKNTNLTITVTPKNGDYIFEKWEDNNDPTNGYFTNGKGYESVKYESSIFFNVDGSDDIYLCASIAELAIPGPNPPGPNARWWVAIAPYDNTSKGLMTPSISNDTLGRSIAFNENEESRFVFPNSTSVSLAASPDVSKTLTYEWYTGTTFSTPTLSRTKVTSLLVGSGKYSVSSSSVAKFDLQAAGYSSYANRVYFVEAKEYSEPEPEPYKIKCNFHMQLDTGGGYLTRYYIVVYTDGTSKQLHTVSGTGQVGDDNIDVEFEFEADELINEITNKYNLRIDLNYLYYRVNSGTQDLTDIDFLEDEFSLNGCTKYSSQGQKRDGVGGYYTAEFMVTEKDAGIDIRTVWFFGESGGPIEPEPEKVTIKTLVSPSDVTGVSATVNEKGNNSNNGTEISIPKGTNYELHAATRDQGGNWKFENWTSSAGDELTSANATSDLVATNDITWTANYSGTSKKLTVKFASGVPWSECPNAYIQVEVGGTKWGAISGSTQSRTEEVDVGKEVTLSVGKITGDDVTFNGWNVSAGSAPDINENLEEAGTYYNPIYKTTFTMQSVDTTVEAKIGKEVRDCGHSDPCFFEYPYNGGASNFSFNIRMGHEDDCTYYYYEAVQVTSSVKQSFVWYDVDTTLNIEIFVTKVGSNNRPEYITLTGDGVIFDSGNNTWTSQANNGSADSMRVTVGANKDPGFTGTSRTISMRVTSW